MRPFVSGENLNRVYKIQAENETFNEVLARLLDSWDEYQRERDDGK